MHAAGPRGVGRAARPGAPVGPRPGRAALAGLGRAADRRQGRAAEVVPAPVDALVRRARVRRPACVQRRRAEADRRPRRAHLRGSSSDEDRRVRAPQVPFVRGGAELMADELVDALRARGHEAELVTIPFKWYPGTRVLDQAFLWRLRRPDRVRRPPDRPRDRDEVPGLLRAPPEQGRLGAAPVPAGLRLRPHRARPVLRVARGPRDATRGRAARRGRARRGAPRVRDVAQRRRPAAALQRDRGRAAAAPAAGARLPHRRARGLRALGQPARPREADRPADRGREGRAVAAGRDRRRGPRPRAARAARRRG